VDEAEDERGAEGDHRLGEARAPQGDDAEPAEHRLLADADEHAEGEEAEDQRGRPFREMRVVDRQQRGDGHRAGGASGERERWR
jgi:nitroreductase